MPVLQPGEYDISYFDGKKGTYRHNAGYVEYERWYRQDGKNSLGEKWLDKAADLADKYQLQGKKVLEIGCAKGFLVEDLRGMGVNAYGLDVSVYAIGEAVRAVKPFLYIGDARTYLINFGDGEFDVVITLHFLECFSKADLPPFISEMNRISKFQYHEVGENPNPKYYSTKTVNEYKSLLFSKNTVILGKENNIRVVK